MPALDTFVSILLIFATTTCGVFDCARRIALGSPERKWKYGILGLTIFSVAAGFSTYLMKDEMDTLSTFMEKNVSKTDPYELSKAAPEKIAKVTRFEASRDYLWRGVLSEHTTIEGKRVLYQPSQDEIKQREQYLISTSGLSLIGAIFGNWAFAFWGAPIFSVGFGYWVGRRELKGSNSVGLHTKQPAGQ